MNTKRLGVLYLKRRQVWRKGGSEREGRFDPAFSPAAQVVVDRTQQVWVLYDAGPKHVKSPLICLPPVCGTADVFFQQMMQLSAKGYRVISVSNANVSVLG